MYKPRITKQGEWWIVTFPRIPGLVAWVGPWGSLTLAGACHAIDRWYRHGNPMGIAMPTHRVSPADAQAYIDRASQFWSAMNAYWQQDIPPDTPVRDLPLWQRLALIRQLRSIFSHRRC